MMEDNNKVERALAVVEEAKKGWDGKKNFTEYVIEDFIPSVAQKEQPKKKDPISRYKSYFGDLPEASEPASVPASALGYKTRGEA